MSHIHSSELAGNRLRLGLVFSAIILVVELVGAYFSNSLALLSDAGHVTADIIALALSWYGVRQSSRPSDPRMTFGYHRVGVIIAVINAVAIFAIALFIFYEVFQRLNSPPNVDAGLMLLIALVGLLANIIVALLLRQEQAHSLNVRSAFWHVLGDALASVGVIAGALIITFTGNIMADAAVSIFIGLIITASGVGILREGLHVLLEGTPPSVDVHQLLQRLRSEPEVLDVHDLHVWSISSEIRAMNGHIVIDGGSLKDAGIIRARLERVIQHNFGISHTTLQMECEDCQAQDIYCSLKESQMPHRQQTR